MSLRNWNFRSFVCWGVFGAGPVRTVGKIMIGSAVTSRISFLKSWKWNANTFTLELPSAAVWLPTTEYSVFWLSLPPVRSVVAGLATWSLGDEFFWNENR